MLLRNSKSNIRNTRYCFQAIDYQYFYLIKECLGQNKERSDRIKIESMKLKRHVKK